MKADRLSKCGELKPDGLMVTGFGAQRKGGPNIMKLGTEEDKFWKSPGLMKLSQTI